VEEVVHSGEAVSGFSLPGTDGTIIETYSLNNHTETGVCILLFYPFDFSSVCTTELCSFRDAEWLLFTENVDVFGISGDSCYAHREFINRHDLPFPLLSDSGGEVAEQYGVLQDEFEGHTRVCNRAVIVVDSSNTIRYKWVADDSQDAFSGKILTDVADVLETITTQGWNRV
jgi:peroxiredoxin